MYILLLIPVIWSSILIKIRHVRQSTTASSATNVPSTEKPTILSCQQTNAPSETSIPYMPRFVPLDTDLPPPYETVVNTVE